ncbi:MAG: DUF4446 family protein [Armatimonadetes bacterium]|nr:DUF4446 family protein [Armatimonadota bacterium]
MQGLLDQFGSQAGGLLIGTAVLVLALLVAVVLLAMKVRTVAKRWSGLMDGTSSENLEQILQGQLDRSEQIGQRLDKTDSRLHDLETKMGTAKRYLGLVKYDAFEDVGGSQSFTLAVYDEQGDGVVLTSQVGRADCRVYAKEIKGGRSTRELSAEEQRAIEVAGDTRVTAGSV